MPDTVPASNLRRMMEEQAGMVVTGPDAAFVEYKLTTQTTHRLNYKTLALGGYENEMQVNAAMQMMVMNQTFNVLGNAVRLARTPNQIGPMMLEPEEGVPQGVILIWRKGHEPVYSIDEGTYAASMTFAVLPPWAQLVGNGAPEPHLH